MERGANTFPFHNLLPYSKSNEGLFLFFSPSLNWIKEKSVATLAIRTFAIQKPTKSVHRITHEKTTFTCPFGIFAYRRILLCLYNAPKKLKKCIKAIFADLIEKTIEVFM